jgi:hypothetical protein
MLSLATRHPANGTTAEPCTASCIDANACDRTQNQSSCSALSKRRIARIPKELRLRKCCHYHIALYHSISSYSDKLKTGMDNIWMSLKGMSCTYTYNVILPTGTEHLTFKSIDRFTLRYRAGYVVLTYSQVEFYLSSLLYLQSSWVRRSVMISETLSMKL